MIIFNLKSQSGRPILEMKNINYRKKDNMRSSRVLIYQGAWSIGNIRLKSTKGYKILTSKRLMAKSMLIAVVVMEAGAQCVLLETMANKKNTRK